MNVHRGQKASPPSEATQGDTYIAAMGRANDVPPPVAKLVNDAQRAGRSVQKVAIEEEGFYLGYTLKIMHPDGSMLQIDVTGAASRYADRDLMSSQDGKLVKVSSEHDAPSESGLFDGSYAASAKQAARYRAWRKRRAYR